MMHQPKLGTIHRKFFSIAIIVLIFSKPIRLITGLPWVSYIDEILMGYIAFLSLYALIKLRIRKFLFILLGVLVYMVLVSVNVYMTAFWKVVAQSVIHLKLFFLFYLIDAFLQKNDINKILKFIWMVTIIGVFLNLAMGTNFFGYAEEHIRYRMGLLRLVGLQVSANSLGLTLAVFYLWFIFKKFPGIQFFIVNTLIFTPLIVLTGSRTALSTIFIGIVFYYLRLKSDSKVRLLPIFGVLGMGLTVWLANTDIIQRTIHNWKMVRNASDSSYIRGIMLYYGVQLARQHFPFGTGAATFGSVLSGGSKVYEVLSLNNKSYFESLSGIYDSNVATILGEFGIIGIIIFLGLCTYLYRLIRWKKNRFFVRALFVALLVFSFSNPIFMNAYPAAIFALIFVLEKKGKETVYENPNHQQYVPVAAKAV